jgi:hypothetical protein
VVDIQNEIGVIKIRPKMYDGPYNNKTFPLVVVLSLVVVLRCIGDNIFLAFLIKLAKNNTNTKSTLINV